MAKNRFNPCVFKARCKMCKIVEMDDRPTMCASMECEFYIPCTLCGMNTNEVDPDVEHCNNPACKHLKEAGEIQRVETSGGHELIEIQQEVVGHQGHQAEEMSKVSTGNRRKPRKITRPGEPPSGLIDEEKEYYQERWQDYEGYYRDPAAYLICHAMILEEIRLDYVQHELLALRGEASAEKEKEKFKIYDNLSKLKQQLPEKESEKLSDDEKALGRIYELYLEEVGKVRKSNITRVLTPEAVALVPELPFNLNPEEMLRNCGCSLIEAQDAVEQIYTSEDMENLGVDALEFLGFKLKEKYALPFDADMEDIDAEEFEDTDAKLNVPT